MSSVKALRNRIKSVKSTQKITKAMRMVSAAKLHRAKVASEFASNFRKKILEMLASAKNNIDISEISPFVRSIIFGSEQYKQTIIILYGSDRGLCGAYNSNMYKLLKREFASDTNVKLVTIGRRIAELTEKIHKSDLIILSSTNPAEISQQLQNFLHDELKKEPATRVVSYFTQFKNTITQIPSILYLMPLEGSCDNSSNAACLEGNNPNIEFEGDNLIDRLSELYLDSNIIANLYESRASEEASRMTAMDNATRNAGDMIEDLTLKMNRTRQAQITKELIEVISGAEAI